MQPIGELQCTDAQKTLENLAGFERDLEELTVDAEFERVGGLDVATEEHQLEWLDDMANEPGRHRVTALGARALVDSPTYLGGVESLAQLRAREKRALDTTGGGL